MSQVPPAPPSPTPPGNVGDHAPHREADDREEIYYQGSPLIRGNIGKIFLSWILALLFLALPVLYYEFHKPKEWPNIWVTVACVVIGVFLLFIPVLILKSVRYRISNYRIDFERGIFGKRIDTLELWHVEDIRFEQSFLDRILGVGNLMVVSHDDTTPKLMMHGLPDPRRLFETLKQRVIAVKRQRGVVKMDTGGHQTDLSNS
jgi:membrane protein YdbS with pleckstrin-like domain